MHAPMALSQSPPCHGQLEHPHHAEANTSSLLHHQRSMITSPQPLPNTGTKLPTQTILIHKVRWSLPAESDSLSKPFRSSSPAPPDTTSAEASIPAHGPTCTRQTSSPSHNDQVSNVSLEGKTPSRTLHANLALCLNGGTPQSNTKSSFSKATEEVSRGKDVSPCPQFSHPICINRQ